jgi:hypothetical protein
VFRTRPDVAQWYEYEAAVADGIDQAGHDRLVPPLDPAGREQYLQVPPEIERGVWELAESLRADDPRRQAAAVERYLGDNHPYSLSIKVGRGEPVSRFLMERKAGHCQFFASAAVILLRCSGVPARYVNGYYAHERAGDGVTVRQRDAHAWAEYWLDGAGWVTLDATPGTGRPDELFPPAPAWRRAWERVTDTLAAARAWVGRVGWTSVALLVAIVAAAWAGLRFWKRRRQNIRRLAAEAYASPGAELAALAARFDRLLKRHGIDLSPNRTWREQLDGNAASAVATADGYDLPSLTAFVDAYNAARFDTDDPAAVRRLGDLLARIEPRN